MRKSVVLWLVSLLILSIGASVAAQDITIVSGNFSEPQILAEAVKILIEENTDLSVEHVRNFQGSHMLHTAMIHGEADMYISWTGTQFTGILGMEVTDEWMDREKVFAYVREQFDERYDIHWFEPFGFNNTYAIVVRSEVAEELGLKKVSDLVELAPEWTIAMDTTFRERAGDGYYDMLQAYGISRFRRPVTMDYGLMYRSVASGDVDAAVAYSTDGRIAAMDLTILEDDKEFFPPYDAALVATNQVLADYPEIAEILEPLFGAIDEPLMQRYNQMVDVDNKSVEEAARVVVNELVYNR